MQHRYRIILSLLCFFSVLANTDSAAYNQKYEPIFITMQEMPQNNGEMINEKLSKQHCQTPKQTDIFQDEDIEEMEFAFESAPRKVRKIVKYLEDPTYFSDGVDWRSTYFVGKSESDKMITAKAIAYKMAQKGWEYKFISSRSLLGTHPNQTAVQLREELKNAVSSDKPTIIIMDELNLLLENSGSKRNNGDLTTSVLCAFLDQQKYNKKFFLIGTMNRVTKLPKSFKSRIILNFTEFPTDTDFNTNNNS